MTVIDILKALIPELQSRQERDEHYLADAEDDCDLERRLHRIDERGRDASAEAIALALHER